MTKMTIRANNPVILPGVTNEHGDGNQNMSVAVEFHNGEKLVSLACDNSGGRMKNLSRCDVRLFIGNSDVTESVFVDNSEKHIVHASMENFETAMNWLRRTEWGMKS
jgi:hypothetical protein